MADRMNILLFFVGLSVFVASAQEKGGPITPCETADELIADKLSCTRYHICRMMEDVEGEFTTDIAICPALQVFDMINSTCVPADKGFLQDPMGCTTFYGCHTTKETSEGYMRRHYRCSGKLRFHPTKKYCTFKTSVPDKLCSKSIANQAIIGVVTSSEDATDAPTSSSSVPSSTSDTSSTRSISSSTAQNLRFSGLTELPAAQLSNIDKIAEVIRGQLLIRRNNNNSVINAYTPSPVSGETARKDLNSKTKLDKIKDDGNRKSKPETRDFEGIYI